MGTTAGPATPGRPGGSPRCASSRNDGRPDRPGAPTALHCGPSRNDTPPGLRVSKRQIALTAALAVMAAEVVLAGRYLTPVALTCLGSTAALVVAALATGWRRNRRPPATFLSDGTGFRTPVHASSLYFGLLGPQMFTFFLAGARQAPIGLAGAALLGAVSIATWRGLWHGVGLTLRPEGIDAARQAGTLHIPWDALATEQPERDPGTPWEIKLAYADPGRVVATGGHLSRDTVVFEGADPDFVAHAIATYAADPARRAAIGTATELTRLHEDMPAPPRGTRQIVAPERARTTVRRIVTAAALVAAAAALNAAPDWLDVLAGLLLLAAAQQLYRAYQGRRAAHRREQNTTGGQVSGTTTAAEP